MISLNNKKSGFSFSVFGVVVQICIDNNDGGRNNKKKRVVLHSFLIKGGDLLLYPLDASSLRGVDDRSKSLNQLFLCALRGKHQSCLDDKVSILVVSQQSKPFVVHDFVDDFIFGGLRRHHDAPFDYRGAAFFLR